MHRFNSGYGSAAAQFRRSPKYIAREVTKDWQADHSQWSDDDALFTYEFLLEVYQQARAWWLKHPGATDAELGAAHHEIVKAFMRGEQLFPGSGRKATPLRGAALRARQNALWNCNSPAEKAELEMGGWLFEQGTQGRRPSAVERESKRQAFLEKHHRHQRTPHPVRAEILGHF